MRTYEKFIELYTLRGEEFDGVFLWNTEVILRKAVGATTILVPIAISIALTTGANPTMYALIVALSTSNAFILPTHQVNALIIGPGGYRVADFVRVGSGMTVIFLVVMLTMVNLVF